MMKRLILSFFLLLSLSLQAQTEKRDSLMNDNIEADSLTSVRPSAFKRAIKKFMNFSDFDTLYISPNRYNYALMATHCTLAGGGFSWAGLLMWTIFTGKPTERIKVRSST